MTKDEALKLALEALEMATELEEGYGVDFKKYGLKVDKDIRAKYNAALTAIKQAFAAPTVQELLGFMNAGHVHDMQQGRLPYGYVYPKGGAGSSVAVYTAPLTQPAPVQEPLSELEKDAANLLFALHDAWPYVHGWCTIESTKKRIQALMRKHGDFADLVPPAAQRQWVGLTDDEWQDLSDRYGLIIFGGLKHEIEVKLKDKNT